MLRTHPSPSTLRFELYEDIRKLARLKHDEFINDIFDLVARFAQAPGAAYGQELPRTEAEEGSAGERAAVRSDHGSSSGQPGGDPPSSGDVKPGTAASDLPAGDAVLHDNQREDKRDDQPGGACDPQGTLLTKSEFTHFGDGWLCTERYDWVNERWLLVSRRSVCNAQEGGAERLSGARPLERPTEEVRNLEPSKEGLGDQAAKQQECGLGEQAVSFFVPALPKP
jgi:hypothetical protein